MTAQYSEGQSWKDVPVNGDEQEVLNIPMGPTGLLMGHHMGKGHPGLNRGQLAESHGYVVMLNISTHAVHYKWLSYG